MPSDQTVSAHRTDGVVRDAMYTRTEQSHAADDRVHIRTHKQHPIAHTQV